MLAEFAIALPLLILLACSLSLVALKTFEVGKNQLADYVLEAEAQHIIEQITRESRVAKEVEISGSSKIQQLKIIFKTVRENGEVVSASDDSGKYEMYSIEDIWETRYFIPHTVNGACKLYAKRQDDGYFLNPIGGNNTFGETNIKRLEYELDAAKKILHVTLELESLVSEHKIKIATAVFMPSCGS